MRTTLFIIQIASAIAAIIAIIMLSRKIYDQNLFIEAQRRNIDSFGRRVKAADELIESQKRLIALQDEQIRLLRE